MTYHLCQCPKCMSSNQSDFVAQTIHNIRNKSVKLDIIRNISTNGQKHVQCMYLG